MASKVLYRDKRSKRVLAYLSAGIERIQRQEEIPTWLCDKPDLSDLQPPCESDLANKCRDR